MNRRRFILMASQIGVWSNAIHLLPFLNNYSYAQTTDLDRFIVLITVEGGMDSTLGLDPKTHKDGSDQKDVFIEYREDEIVQAGNIRLGPAASALASYSNDIQIINGINMRRDAGHEALLDYLISGNGNGASPILPIEIAATTTTGSIGVLVNSTFSSGTRKVVLTQIDEVSNSASSTNDINELLKLMPLSMDRVFSNAFEGYLESAAPLMECQRQLAEYTTSNGEEVKTIAATALAFATGLSRQAALNINSLVNNIDLDTHSTHEKRHLESQTQVWNKIAEIFKVFKSIPYKQGSVFDRTTFMVATEFSRTPALNNGAGKDHNPYTNSILLAGNGIMGNKVVGQSHIIRTKDSPRGEPLHISTPLDYKSGLSVQHKIDSNENVGLIFPENVIRTLAQIYDDPADFSSVSLRDIAVIPGVVKK